MHLTIVGGTSVTCERTSTLQEDGGIVRGHINFDVAKSHACK